MNEIYEWGVGRDFAQRMNEIYEWGDSKGLFIRKFHTFAGQILVFEFCTN